jgi:hypothetical protein
MHRVSTTTIAKRHATQMAIKQIRFAIKKSGVGDARFQIGGNKIRPDEQYSVRMANTFPRPRDSQLRRTEPDYTLY